MLTNENGAFTEQFKQYEESKTYNDLTTKEIKFDPTFLELDSITDIHNIMTEINGLSYKLYTYGVMCDSQTRVLQELEDEFEKWKAIILHNDMIEDKQFKTDKSKERYLMVTYEKEYVSFSKTISAEKFKLSLLQRIISSLEKHGYKLHDLKDYNLAIKQNS